MPGAIFFAFIILVIFLILTEVVSVNVSYKDTLCVEIDLIIFGVRLVKAPEARQNRKKQKRRRKRPPSPASLIKFIRRILKSGQTSLERTVIPISASEPHEYAIRYSLISFLLLTIYDIIKNNVDTVHFEEIILPRNENNNIKPELRITSVFPLRIAIGSLLWLIYDYLKDGYKRKCKKAK